MMLNKKLERLNDNMWQILSKYHEEREQMRREYNEIIMPIQSNPMAPESVPDHIRNDGVGSLESPTQMQCGHWYTRSEFRPP